MKVLDMSHCEIGDNAAKLLRTAIGKDKGAVTSVALRTQQYTRERNCCVRQGIFQNIKRIEKYIYQWNPFSRYVGKYIAKSIRTNASITHLDFLRMATGFYDAAASVMATSLKFNKVLKWLNLSHNPISDVGAKNPALTVRSATKHSKH